MELNCRLGTNLPQQQKYALQSESHAGNTVSQAIRTIVVRGNSFSNECAQLMVKLQRGSMGKVQWFMKTRQFVRETFQSSLRVSKQQCELAFKTREKAEEFQERLSAVEIKTQDPHFAGELRKMYVGMLEKAYLARRSGYKGLNQQAVWLAQKSDQHFCPKQTVSVICAMCGYHKLFVPKWQEQDQNVVGDGRKIKTQCPDCPLLAMYDPATHARLAKGCLMEHHICLACAETFCDGGDIDASYNASLDSTHKQELSRLWKQCGECCGATDNFTANCERRDRSSIFGHNYFVLKKKAALVYRQELQKWRHNRVARVQEQLMMSPQIFENSDKFENTEAAQAQRAEKARTKLKLCPVCSLDMQREVIFYNQCSHASCRECAELQLQPSALPDRIPEPFGGRQTTLGQRELNRVDACCFLCTQGQDDPQLHRVLQKRAAYDNLDAERYCKVTFLILAVNLSAFVKPMQQLQLEYESCSHEQRQHLMEDPDLQHELMCGWTSEMRVRENEDSVRDTNGRRNPGIKLASVYVPEDRSNNRPQAVCSLPKGGRSKTDVADKPEDLQNELMEAHNERIANVRMEATRDVKLRRAGIERVAMQLCKQLQATFAWAGRQDDQLRNQWDLPQNCTVNSWQDLFLTHVAAPENANFQRTISLGCRPTQTLIFTYLRWFFEGWTVSLQSAQEASMRALKQPAISIRPTVGTFESGSGQESAANNEHAASDYGKNPLIRLTWNENNGPHVSSDHGSQIKVNYTGMSDQSEILRSVERVTAALRLMRCQPCQWDAPEVYDWLQGALQQRDIDVANNQDAARILTAAREGTCTIQWDAEKDWFYLVREADDSVHPVCQAWPTMFEPLREALVSAERHLTSQIRCQRRSVKAKIGALTTSELEKLEQMREARRLQSELAKVACDEDHQYAWGSTSITTRPPASATVQNAHMQALQLATQAQRLACRHRGVLQINTNASPVPTVTSTMRTDPASSWRPNKFAWNFPESASKTWIIDMPPNPTAKQLAICTLDQLPTPMYPQSCGASLRDFSAMRATDLTDHREQMRSEFGVHQCVICNHHQVDKAEKRGHSCKQHCEPTCKVCHELPFEHADNDWKNSTHVCEHGCKKNNAKDTVTLDRNMSNRNFENRTNGASDYINKREENEQLHVKTRFFLVFFRVVSLALWLDLKSDGATKIEDVRHALNILSEVDVTKDGGAAPDAPTMVNRLEFFYYMCTRCFQTATRMAKQRGNVSLAPNVATFKRELIKMISKRAVYELGQQGMSQIDLFERQMDAAGCECQETDTSIAVVGDAVHAPPISAAKHVRAANARNAVKIFRELLKLSAVTVFDKRTGTMQNICDVAFRPQWEYMLLDLCTRDIGLIKYSSQHAAYLFRITMSISERNDLRNNAWTKIQKENGETKQQMTARHGRWARLCHQVHHTATTCGDLFFHVVKKAKDLAHCICGFMYSKLAAYWLTNIQNDEWWAKYCFNFTNAIRSDLVKTLNNGEKKSVITVWTYFVEYLEHLCTEDALVCCEQYLINPALDIVQFMSENSHNFQGNHFVGYIFDDCSEREMKKFRSACMGLIADAVLLADQRSLAHRYEAVCREGHVQYFGKLTPSFVCHLRRCWMGKKNKTKNAGMGPLVDSCAAMMGFHGVNQHRNNITVPFATNLGIAQVVHTFVEQNIPALMHMQFLMQQGLQHVKQLLCQLGCEAFFNEIVVHDRLTAQLVKHLHQETSWRHPPTMPQTLKTVVKYFEPIDVGRAEFVTLLCWVVGAPQCTLLDLFQSSTQILLPPAELHAMRHNEDQVMHKLKPVVSIAVVLAEFLYQNQQHMRRILDSAVSVLEDTLNCAHDGPFVRLRNHLGNEIIDPQLMAKGIRSHFKHLEDVYMTQTSCPYFSKLQWIEPVLLHAAFRIFQNSQKSSQCAKSALLRNMYDFASRNQIVSTRAKRKLEATNTACAAAGTAHDETELLCVEYFQPRDPKNVLQELLSNLFELDTQLLSPAVVHAFQTNRWDVSNIANYNLKRFNAILVDYCKTYKDTPLSAAVGRIPDKDFFGTIKVRGKVRVVTKHSCETTRTDSSYKEKWVTLPPKVWLKKVLRGVEYHAAYTPQQALEIEPQRTKKRKRAGTKSRQARGLSRVHGANGDTDAERPNE